MDRAQALNLASRYAASVARAIAPKAIVLYGSRAKGTDDADSDIDIAVYHPDCAADALDVSGELWAIAAEYSGRIEPILLTSLDRESHFIREICRHGIVLFGDAGILN